MICIRNKGRYFWIGMYVLLFAAMAIIMVLSLTEPQHNLFPWQMAVGTVLGFFALVSAVIIWDRLKITMGKGLWAAYALLLAGLGAALYVVSCMGRNVPASLLDYGVIWDAAKDVAEGNELSAAAESYFKIYSNNIKPMLFLGALFRFAGFLGVEDPFYFVLIFSVAGVAGAVLGGVLCCVCTRTMISIISSFCSCLRGFFPFGPTYRHSIQIT